MFLNILKIIFKMKHISFIGNKINLNITFIRFFKIMYGKYIGKPIIDIMKKMNVEIIYSDLFNSCQTNKLGSKICKDLYWKYSKESIGAIKMLDNLIDGVIFLSAFPCGLDSLVNELVMRKINIPYLNMII